MSSTTLKHIPLARPTEQIRLLRLRPGTGIIRLNVQTYELKESPEFVALSYEWGDGSEMHDIIIDGAVFKIRQNLHDALECIRILQADRSSARLFDEDSPHFWIDAITIDQSNTAEKTHQVSIMGNVFRQASHVIAWLGSEQCDDYSVQAMQYLRLYCQKSAFSYDATLPAKEMTIKWLCARSYFQRLWIVQECILARKLDLVCGLQHCSWEHLHKFNWALSYEPNSMLVHRLLEAKSDFEKYSDGLSIQSTMSLIMYAAIGKHCSQFHDRVYGLLGVLQQNFQSTGMEVDYSIGREELMIKTEEFLTSDPKEVIHYLRAYWIEQIFESDASMEVRARVAWYWQINEIMHKLDADIIKGFHKLETLCGEEERALTFQTICWVVGGFGVDLFSPVKDTSSLNTTMTMPTVSLESLKNNESHNPSHRVFIMHSRCTTGIHTYCIRLTHRPSNPHALPDGYVRTESDSWGCRSLLETYSKHVQTLGRMRESLEVSTKAPDPQMETQLPTQVEWMVLSNLLAQHFLSQYSRKDWPNRTTETDGFVRNIEPEGKDLGTFLTESLFSKYRMSVAKTSAELPANALTSVEVEITNSNDADLDCSDFGKKILVASLYDNDA